MQGSSIAKFQDKGFSGRGIFCAGTVGPDADARYLAMQGKIRLYEAIGGIALTGTRLAPSAKQGVLGASVVSAGQGGTGGWRPCGDSADGPALRRSRRASTFSCRSLCFVLPAVALRADFRTGGDDRLRRAWAEPAMPLEAASLRLLRSEAKGVHLCFRRRSGRQDNGIAPDGRALSRCQRLIRRNGVRHAFPLGQPLRGMTARLRNGLMDFLQVG